MFILLMALSVYGLNRNHRRQASPRMTGSFDVEDRDELRIRAEVAARRSQSGLCPAARPQARHLSRV